MSIKKRTGVLIGALSIFVLGLALVFGQGATFKGAVARIKSPGVSSQTLAPSYKKGDKKAFDDSPVILRSELKPFSYELKVKPLFKDYPENLADIIDFRLPPPLPDGDSPFGHNPASPEAPADLTLALPNTPAEIPVVRGVSHQGEFRRYKAAVCYMRWAENFPDPNEADFRTIFDKVNDYYDEVAYGLVEFDFVGVADSHELVPIPADHGGYAERIAAVQNCDDLLNYEHLDVLFVYPSISTAGGLGDRSYYYADGDWQDLSVIRVGSYDHAYAAESEALGNDIPVPIFNSFSHSLVEHELGHAPFNLEPHANFLECGDRVYERLQRGFLQDPSLSPDGFPGCSIVEYGNPFDVMGASFFEGHISAWGKYFAGRWSSYQNVVQSGDYVISALEVQSDIPHVVRIPYQDEALCVEYRKPIGYDRNNSDAAFALSAEAAGGIPDGGGLALMLCPMAGPYRENRILLDTVPNDAVPVRKSGGARSLSDTNSSLIREGKVFEDEVVGLRLEWESVGENKALIHLGILDPDRLALAGAGHLELNRSIYGDACIDDSTIAKLTFRYESELELEGSYKVEVTGLGDNAAPVRLDRFNIEDLGPGESIIKVYRSIRPYRNLHVKITTPEGQVSEEDVLLRFSC